METTIAKPRRHRLGVLRGAEPEDQAFTLLYLGYVLLPLIAGVDKFFEVLVDWDKYLSPFVSGLAGARAGALMSAAGGVEVAAAFLVAVKPRVGGLVVAGWLLGIIVNLLLIPGYFDVALRDLGLCLGALALSRLSKEDR